MQECFRRYVSLKNLTFLVELKQPNLRFSFNVFIKSRRLPGDQCSLWGAQIRRTTRSAEPPANPQNHQSICAVKYHAHLQCSNFDVVHIWHSPFETLHWLCPHGCEIACALQQTFAQCTIFLQVHCWWLTSRTCANTLINETNAKYEATTLYQFEVLLFI